MKRKLIGLLLSVVLLCCVVGCAFIGCKDKEPDRFAIQYYVGEYQYKGKITICINQCRLDHPYANMPTIHEIDVVGITAEGIHRYVKRENRESFREIAIDENVAAAMSKHFGLLEEKVWLSETELTTDKGLTIPITSTYLELLTQFDWLNAKLDYADAQKPMLRCFPDIPEAYIKKTLTILICGEVIGTDGNYYSYDFAWTGLEII